MIFYTQGEDERIEGDETREILSPRLGTGNQAVSHECCERKKVWEQVDLVSYSNVTRL